MSIGMVVISIASGLRVGIGIGACTVQRIIWTVLASIRLQIETYV
jgi:hypothetical protein